VFQIPFQKFLKKQEEHSVDVEKNFEFQHITSDKIEKIIDKINIKKTSEFDNIPAKVIKQCKPIISNQLTSLINLSIYTMSSPILSATVEKKVLNFSETSHVSFIISLSSHRIIF
jgi:hypothetical protein